MKTIIIWLAMVFILSVYPSLVASSLPYADKVVHFIIYAITCWLFFSILRKRKPFSKAIIASILLSAGYGLLMEVVQIFVPTREFSAFDFVANTLGAISAGVFIILSFKDEKRKSLKERR